MASQYILSKPQKRGGKNEASFQYVCYNMKQYKINVIESLRRRRIQNGTEEIFKEKIT